MTVRDLMAETMPQLRFVLRKRGRILWPRLEPTVSGNFQPSEDGVKEIISDWRLRRSGHEPPRSPEQQRRDLAWRITAARWTGEAVEEGEPGKAVQPIPGVSREAAAAVLAWAASDACPEDVFGRDVAPHLRGLRATADQQG